MTTEITNDCSRRLASIKKHGRYFVYLALFLSIAAVAWQVNQLDERVDTLVNVNNQDSEFVARKFIEYETTRDGLLEHVGLHRLEDNTVEPLEKFDLDCVVVDDSMTPPRLKCDREWQNSDADQPAH